jgi:hypothetical protein
MREIILGSSLRLLQQLFFKKKNLQVDFNCKLFMLFSFDHLLYGKLSGLHYGKKNLHVKCNHVQTSSMPFVC